MEAGKHRNWLSLHITAKEAYVIGMPDHGQPLSFYKAENTTQNSLLLATAPDCPGQPGRRVGLEISILAVYVLVPFHGSGFGPWNHSICGERRRAIHKVYQHPARPACEVQDLGPQPPSLRVTIVNAECSFDRNCVVEMWKL